MKTRIICYISLIACIFATPTAIAATWIDVEKSTPSGYFQIDADSTKKISDNTYVTRWQTSTTPTFLNTTYTGSIDCTQAYITLYTSEQTRTDSLSSKFSTPPITTNYIENKIFIDNKSRDLNQYEMLEKFRFPGPGSSELTMIRSICQQEPVVVPNANIVKSLQDKLQCSSQASASPLCNKNSETQEAITLLFLRIGQAKTSCPINLDDSTAIINDSIRQSTECRKAANCELENIKLTISGIGNDLSRVLSNKSCTFIQATLDRIKKDTETQASILIFRSCINKTIIELDDHTSPADNIAKAAFATCRSTLAYELSNSKTFEQNIEPSVIANVLATRKNSKEKKGLPNKKKYTSPYL